MPCFIITKMNVSHTKFWHLSFFWNCILLSVNAIFHGQCLPMKIKPPKKLVCLHDMFWNMFWFISYILCCTFLIYIVHFWLVVALEILAYMKLMWVVLSYRWNQIHTSQQNMSYYQDLSMLVITSQSCLWTLSEDAAYRAVILEIQYVLYIHELSTLHFSQQAFLGWCVYIYTCILVIEALISTVTYFCL